MRIVTWNCQMAFAKKKELLLKQNPDIAIIQECSRKDLESLQDQSFQTIWFGNIPYKGIGVLYRSQWSIRPVAEPIFPWIVPVEFEGPERFRLLAVWSCPKKTSFSHYVACTSEAIAAHPEWLEDGPVMLAGDFNSSAEWDNQTNGAHSALIKTLDAKELVSFYHHHHNEEHGHEKNHTHHFRRHRAEPFHIDYVFGPKSWTERITSCVVGDPDIWNSHSDHCPIILDIAPLSN